MSSDWLPRSRPDRLEMAKLWTEILAERWEDWGLQEKEVARLTELYETARLAFDRNNSDARGPVAAAAAVTAFNALVSCMRDIKKRHFFVPPLTNGDLISLNLRPHDNARTEHTAVKEIVDFVLRPGAEAQIVVDFRQRGEAHKAKPRGYAGAVIIWGVLDGQPADNEQLPRHTMAPRTPHILHFKNTERGKTVWVTLAWQNTRGITGEWPAYQSAIVP